jgi:two-component system cell cycle response regulator CpdR
MAQILLADDDPSVREFVKRALVHQGHSVTAANDGTEALDCLGTQPFDLMITDVVMPGLDGIELTQKASVRCPEMKILVITGYADQQQRAAVSAGGIESILIKPFTLQQICSAANAALDHLT